MDTSNTDRPIAQDRVFTHNGVSMTLKEWADFCGTAWRTFWARANSMGISEAIDFVHATWLCTYQGCMKQARYNNRTLCNTHHYRLRRTGSISQPVRMSDIDRFISNIDLGTGCWMYKMRGRIKYGSAMWRGKSVLAHRIMWEIHNGEIPDGMIVCHSCDTPGCVRPSHLWLGTHKDNSDDKIRKGRAPWQNPNRSSRRRQKRESIE